MKKLIFLSFLLIVSASAFAQTGKPVTKPVAKPAPVQPSLKTLNDSASYAIGMSIAGFCKNQSIAKLNTSLITKSCNDVMGDKPALISETAANDIINRLLISGRVTSKPAPAPVNNTPTIKTKNDSVSYAIGLNHATFFKQQGITKLNSALIIRAVNDVLGNKPLRFDDRTANNVMNKILMQIQEEKVKSTIDAGNVFLENNKKKPGIKVTESGLQYEVITEGTGIKPAKADTFVCHYRGTLIDGTEFDASYNRGQPLIYPVTAVIPGWTEGLQLMSVGSKYKFYIPYKLGYGVFGSPPVIPGGAALVFEVELLDVKKSSASQQVKPN